MTCTRLTHIHTEKYPNPNGEQKQQAVYHDPIYMICKTNTVGGSTLASYDNPILMLAPPQAK